MRKSGRVRLHKARENNNGTFSIGKTWVLDHLSAIESYTGGTAANYEEQQRKEWAGSTGMLVTIQKPYFWQTVTAKEKDFFIGSLVKIYRKYTGGDEPHLTGFTEKELAEFSSHPQRSSLPQSQTPMSESSEAGARSTLTDYRTSESRGRNGETHSLDDRPPSSASASTRDTNHERGSTPSGLGLQEASRTTTPSDPKVRMQALRKGSAGHSSRPDLGRSDPSARTIASESSFESLPGKAEAQTPPPPFINADRFRPNGTHSPLVRSQTPDTPPLPAPRSPERSRQGPAARPAQAPPPERKRPPLGTGDPPNPESRKETPVSNFVTPSETPAPPEPSKPKERSPSRLARLADIVVPKSTFDYFSSKKAGTDGTDEREEEKTAKVEPNGNNQEGLRGLPSALSKLSSPDSASSQTLSPEDGEHRPGLGPMIKKRSPKEIANVFRKAATAHNAFKPRAGGAADKLREEAAKVPNTPDGINGVFPAPARELMTPASQPTPSINVESDLSTPAEDPGTATPQAQQPEDRPRTASGPSGEPSGRDSPEKAKDALPVPEERRVRRPSNNSAKFAKALGIDPGLIEGRTAEIETVLNDLGWGETDKKKKTFEELHADLRRDLARVETGSWFGGFDQSDERINAVGRLLDKAIAECDELEGVLTLYNVELGVCQSVRSFYEILTISRHLAKTLPILKPSRRACRCRRLTRSSSTMNSRISCRLSPCLPPSYVP